MIFSPALLSVMAGKKVIWTLHDENAFTGGCHFTGACQKFNSQCYDCPLLINSGTDDISYRNFQLKKQLYPFINPFIVTPSKWLSEIAKTSALFKNYPISTIPNPLNMNIFQPAQNKISLRKKYDLPEDAFVILSGCEDLNNPRKNAKVLIETFNILSGKTFKIPVILVLYGHGKLPDINIPVKNI